VRIGISSKPVVIAALCAAALARAQSRATSNTGEHWVATWATAQQLTAASFAGRAGPPPASRRDGPEVSNLPATFADQTVRMVARVSLGGRRIRIELANMAGAQPLEIGAAHIGLHKGGGEIAEGTDRVVTFGGRSSFAIPAGVLAVSDPVDLDIAPLSDLAVSIYLPHDTGMATNHTVGLHTAYISKGDVTGSSSMPDPTTMFAYAWLSGVDVAAPADAFSIVALGDSITDGFATTRNADRAWPTLLAKRLNADKETQHAAVVNEGISGNQVLRDGAGVSALARLDRDVLTRPGVKWVILLEGINDINFRGRMDGPNALTSDELIWGYQQILARCHAHGIKVIGVTIMPEEGVPTASERGEEIRQTVNRWILAKGNFDAVVDFDAAVRDRDRPVWLKPEFDPGDHIHPNDTGNQAMAEAFDLGLFKK
jgi:lysophospholipase L1-like esterase